MSRATPRVLGFALVIALLVSLFSIPASAATGPAPGTAGSTAMGLPLALTRALRPAVSRGGTALAALRPRAPGKVKILLVSSGVDTSLFPPDLRDRVHLLWGSGDAAGYGTYAATALFQLLPDADISSLTVYQGQAFQPLWQESILDWAVKNAGQFDAVLYAVPPSDFVDPVTLMMAGETKGVSDWSVLLRAIGDRPLRDKRGRAIFGIATDGAVRAKQMSGMTTRQRAVVDKWSFAVKRWQTARAQLQALAAKGLPAVAPAGDLGPNVQTIFGIANLPEVVTVGAFDGRTIPRTSSSGPGLDGRAKPDLAAPANLVGLLPEQSLLATLLPGNPRLRPAWFSAGAPAGGERVRVNSTIPAAAVVAAQLGALHASGIRSPRILKGALVAGATPLSGVPVWRQGAGVLRRPVTAAQVRARGVAIRPADLGPEPSRGAWATRVTFWRTRPTGARTRLTDFAGVGPNGKGYTRRMASDGGGPVKASVSNGGVSLSTGMGERWDAGIFCGYTTVSLPRSSRDASPTVSGDGLPPGAREHIPTCLVNGSRLVLHGFYIHNQPAEDLTFSVIPDIPGRAELMSGLPRQLRLDPGGQIPYTRVTGKDGDAVLTNIPPGYYRFRLFSDYGGPISFTAKNVDGRAVTLHQDLGENPSYQDLTGYLLSAANLTGDDLRKVFGASNVKEEKPTGAYLVTIGPATIRVVLNFYKNKPGTAVSSRYIDLIERDDLAFSLADAPDLQSALGDPDALLGALQPLGRDPWLVEGVNAPDLSRAAEDVVARYNGARQAASASLGGLLGVARYPFNLTTPNYITRLSLNFGYTLRNAAVLVLLRIGGESGSAFVADAELVHAMGDPSGISPRITEAPAGSKGLASFNFDVISEGVSSGELVFVFVPSEAVTRQALPVTHLEIEDVSMRVATWTNTLWPATLTPHGMGHEFSIFPNVAPWQMNHPACRPKTARGLSYTECEDWTVLVHSPTEDAMTAGVRLKGDEVTRLLQREGGLYADPHRGVRDFGFALSQAFTMADLSTNLDLGTEFRTNGRFWEQLAFPLDFIRRAPGVLTIEIVDNMHGRESDLLPHRNGAAPVVPYVPYATS